MKKFLKVASIVLVIAMIACFASCGGSGTDGNTTDTQVVKVIDINLTEEEYAFGVDKDQPELLEDVNNFIEKIMKDGTFDDICNNYFGDGEPVGVTSAEFDKSRISLLLQQMLLSNPLNTQKATSIMVSIWKSLLFLQKSLEKSL